MRYFTNKGEIEENIKQKRQVTLGSDIIHCSALYHYNSKNFDYVATLLQIQIFHDK